MKVSVLHILALTLLVSVLALGAAGCGPRKPGLYDGWLYYTVYEGGHYRIERMDRNGNLAEVVRGIVPERSASAKTKELSTRQELNDAAASRRDEAAHPSISSDGRMIAYMSGKPPVVCIDNIETGENLFTSKRDASYLAAKFSSHSDAIVYLRHMTDEQSKEEEIEQRAKGTYKEVDPSLVSPHVRKKAYQILNQASPYAPMQLVLEGYNFRDVCWGNTVGEIYYGDAFGEREAAVYSIKTKAGSKRRKILESGDQIAMAPTGTELAYVSDNALHLYDVRTKQERPLVQGKSITSPTWDPLAKRIAYVQDGMIYVADRMGGAPERISDPLDKIIDVWWAKSY